MTAADEIRYTDLTLTEQATLDSAVYILEKAIADSALVRAWVDANEA